MEIFAAETVSIETIRTEIAAENNEGKSVAAKSTKSDNEKQNKKKEPKSESEEDKKEKKVEAKARHVPKGQYANVQSWVQAANQAFLTLGLILFTGEASDHTTRVLLTGDTESVGPALSHLFGAMCFIKLGTGQNLAWLAALQGKFRDVQFVGRVKECNHPTAAAMRAASMAFIARRIEALSKGGTKDVRVLDVGGSTSRWTELGFSAKKHPWLKLHIANPRALNKPEYWTSPTCEHAAPYGGSCPCSGDDWDVAVSCHSAYYPGVRQKLGELALLGREVYLVCDPRAAPNVALHNGEVKYRPWILEDGSAGLGVWTDSVTELPNYAHGDLSWVSRGWEVAVKLMVHVAAAIPSVPVVPLPRPVVPRRDMVEVVIDDGGATQPPDPAKFMPDGRAKLNEKDAPPRARVFDVDGKAAPASTVVSGGRWVHCRRLTDYGDTTIFQVVAGRSPVPVVVPAAQVAFDNSQRLNTPGGEVPVFRAHVEQVGVAVLEAGTFATQAAKKAQIARAASVITAKACKSDPSDPLHVDPANSFVYHRSLVAHAIEHAAQGGHALRRRVAEAAAELAAADSIVGELDDPLQKRLREWQRGPGVSQYLWPSVAGVWDDNVIANPRFLILAICLVSLLTVLEDALLWLTVGAGEGALIAQLLMTVVVGSLEYLIEEKVSLRRDVGLALAPDKAKEAELSQHSRSISDPGRNGVRLVAPRAGNGSRAVCHLLRLLACFPGALGMHGRWASRLIFLLVAVIHLVLNCAQVSSNVSVALPSIGLLDGCASWPAIVVPWLLAYVQLWWRNVTDANKARRTLKRCISAADAESQEVNDQAAAGKAGIMAGKPVESINWSTERKLPGAQAKVPATYPVLPSLSWEQKKHGKLPSSIGRIGAVVWLVIARYPGRMVRAAANAIVAARYLRPLTSFDDPAQCEAGAAYYWEGLEALEPDLFRGMREGDGNRVEALRPYSEERQALKDAGTPEEKLKLRDSGFAQELRSADSRYPEHEMFEKRELVNPSMCADDPAAEEGKKARGVCVSPPALACRLLTPVKAATRWAARECNSRTAVLYAPAYNLLQLGAIFTSLIGAGVELVIEGDVSNWDGWQTLAAQRFFYEFVCRATDVASDVEALAAAQVAYLAPVKFKVSTGDVYSGVFEPSGRDDTTVSNTLRCLALNGTVGKAAGVRAQAVWAAGDDSAYFVRPGGHAVEFDRWADIAKRFFGCEVTGRVKGIRALSFCSKLFWPIVPVSTVVDGVQVMTRFYCGPLLWRCMYKMGLSYQGDLPQKTLRAFSLGGLQSVAKYYSGIPFLRVMLRHGMRALDGVKGRFDSEWRWCPGDLAEDHPGLVASEEDDHHWLHTMHAFYGADRDWVLDERKLDEALAAQDGPVLVLPELDGLWWQLAKAEESCGEDDADHY